MVDEEVHGVVADLDGDDPIHALRRVHQLHAAGPRQREPRVRNRPLQRRLDLDLVRDAAGNRQPAGAIGRDFPPQRLQLKQPRPQRHGGIGRYGRRRRGKPFHAQLVEVLAGKLRRREFDRADPRLLQLDAIARGGRQAAQSAAVERNGDGRFRRWRRRQHGRQSADRRRGGQSVAPIVAAPRGGQLPGQQRPMRAVRLQGGAQFEQRGGGKDRSAVAPLGNRFGRESLEVFAGGHPVAQQPPGLGRQDPVEQVRRGLLARAAQEHRPQVVEPLLVFLRGLHIGQGQRMCGIHVEVHVADAFRPVTAEALLFEPV